MNYRSGSYIVYNDLECYLISSIEKWELISQNKKCLKFGFLPYEKGFPYYKIIDKKEIKSAFYVRTKSRYKGFVFTLEENKFLEEGKVRLWLTPLDFNAFDYFGFNYRDEDHAFLEVEINDLDQIWEEREPLLDFPFTVEKVKYLKGGEAIT